MNVSTLTNVDQNLHSNKLILTFNITPEVTEFLRRLQRGKHEPPGLLISPQKQ